MTDVSNGLTGNRELEELPIGNAQLSVKQIPIDEVDALAEELVSEYSNPKFRVWYCGVIYEFGIAQVNDWRARAASGKSPGGLFGYYVKQARNGQIKKRRDINIASQSTHGERDTVYLPVDSIAQLVSEGYDSVMGNQATPDKAAPVTGEGR